MSIIGESVKPGQGRGHGTGTWDWDTEGKIWTGTWDWDTEGKRGRDVRIRLGTRGIMYHRYTNID